MKKDITNESDVEQLVYGFYTLLRKDDEVGHFFNEVIEIDWDHHMPRICNFWSSILLGTNTYKDNAMKKHLELSQISKIEDHHVDRWMYLWVRSIDERFEGSIAEMAKDRASQIGELMKFKLKGSSLL